MMVGGRIIAVGAIAVTAVAAGPQQLPQQAPVFRAGVDLVALDVTVVDRSGAPVKGLDASAFTVRINNQPRPVRTLDYIEYGAGAVDSVRTRTDDGFTRSTTVTNGQGETATRDLTVARDKEAGTVTREAHYTTFDGRQGSMSDVVQRTDDGYTRDTSRTLPNGTTQTRNVDVSCDKDAATCIKQVVVGKEP